MPSSEVNSGYHISNEIWLVMPNGQWVEEGLAVGCSAANAMLQNPGTTCSQDGGQPAYMQFWGDANSSLHSYFHLIDTLSNDGNQHTYQILNPNGNSSTDYSIYLDGSQVGTSRDQIYSYGSYLEAGMELYSPGINPGEYTAGKSSSTYRFNNYIQDSPYPTELVFANFDTSTSSSSSCGPTYNCSMDNCSEASDGYCLYWHRDSNFEWTDYKPS